jgi:catechol 2,3-dioxygenase-like lactoylglutathione lyase family enzyme
MSDRPLVDGVSAAILGVDAFETHVDFYCSHLGFEIAAEGVVERSVARALWDVDDDVAVTFLAAAGAPGGRIDLVLIEGEQPAAQHPHMRDLGLIGLDVYTKDIQQTYGSLLASGFAWNAPPTTYGVPMGDGSVRLTEAFCKGPGGVDVVFLQPEAPRGTRAWDSDPRRLHTELTSVLCHVPDVDAEVAFWVSLGLQANYDVTFSSPGLDTVADLDPGSVVRLAFLAGEQTARIEVINMPNTQVGLDRRTEQRPARGMGHSGWRVQTRNLSRALERVNESGGRHKSVVTTHDPIHGTARVAGAFTPNDIFVQLWEDLA